MGWSRKVTAWQLLVPRTSAQQQQEEEEADGKQEEGGRQRSIYIYSVLALCLPKMEATGLTGTADRCMMMQGFHASRLDLIEILLPTSATLLLLCQVLRCMMQCASIRQGLCGAQASGCALFL